MPRIVRRPPSCRVPGCQRPLRYKAARLCQMHYFRLRRCGALGEAESRKGRRSLSFRWRGDVAYRGLHLRIVHLLGAASDYACANNCGRPALHWAYQHDDPNEQIDRTTGLAYSTDPARYAPMCVPCHKLMDLHRDR